MAKSDPGEITELQADGREHHCNYDFAVWVGANNACRRHQRQQKGQRRTRTRSLKRCPNTAPSSRQINISIIITKWLPAS